MTPHVVVDHDSGVCPACSGTGCPACHGRGETRGDVVVTSITCACGQEVSGEQWSNMVDTLCTECGSDLMPYVERAVADADDEGEPDYERDDDRCEVKDFYHG